MRIPRRYLLLVLVATVLLVSAVGIPRLTRRASAITPVDCASDCRESRDKTLEKCDTLPEVARDKCKERASKQYDKCVEKCGSGQSGDTSPGGF